MREYYRGKQTALWTQLIPKLNERDINSSDASHELDHSENMSTFDDPNRLISKFWTIFPTPPPPPYTPPFNQNQKDTSYVSQPNSRFENITEDTVTYKPHTKVTKKPEPPTQGPSTMKSSDSESGVPLSVTIVIGCVFFFLNLLVFAGLYYYHRKKSRKYRENPANSAGPAGQLHHQISDNRMNGDRNNSRGNTPETTTMMYTKSDDTVPKVASINHKPVSNAHYTYAPVSKPVAPPQGPGGYNYSALSQKTTSPMHSQNQIQTTSLSNPPAREARAPSEGSQASKASNPGSNPNQSRAPGGPDQTPKTEPKVDPRAKHIVRGNHTVSSNNAITIV